jgi:hypothetical protein
MDFQAKLKTLKNRCFRREFDAFSPKTHVAKRSKE